MKWVSMLSGFLLYGVLGAIGAGLLMRAIWPANSSFGEAGILILASMTGLALGPVGVCAGYFVHKKEYHAAAGVSVLLILAVATVALSIFSWIA